MKARIQFMGWKCWTFGAAYWNDSPTDYEFRVLNIHFGPLVISISPQGSRAL